MSNDRDHSISEFLVSFDWLSKQLGKPNVRIVDASWYLPAHNRSAKAEFALNHISGAVYFDIEAISDQTSGLPHTMPSAVQFAENVGGLGISGTDTIIIYDSIGMFSAPRVWWMFRVFGAKNAFLLDGGFDQWKAEGRPIDSAVSAYPSARYVAQVNELAMVDFKAMSAIVDNGNIQIADARGPGRFEGKEPEPRAGMKSGHMPGALNVPYSSLSENGRLKPLSELKKVLEAAGLDLEKPVVTSCGSGITAAVITLALQSLGHRHNMLYDGSWAEWGGRPDTKIAIGPSKI